MLELEGWPFFLADFALSEAQPRAVALVARVEEEVTGFFTAHHFGDTAYLNMNCKVSVYAITPSVVLRCGVLQVFKPTA